MLAVTMAASCGTNVASPQSDGGHTSSSPDGGSTASPLPACTFPASEVNPLDVPDGDTAGWGVVCQGAFCGSDAGTGCPGAGRPCMSGCAANEYAVVVYRQDGDAGANVLSPNLPTACRGTTAAVEQYLQELDEGPQVACCPCE
jgi:hypothetical protein